MGHVPRPSVRLHPLTCCSLLSMSPALRTMGPLTAYSTAFTCGFKVSMVRVFSRIRAGSPVSTAASAVLNRFSPHRSEGPCVLERACCHKHEYSQCVRSGARGARGMKCLRRCMSARVLVRVLVRVRVRVSCGSAGHTSERAARLEVGGVFR